MCLDFFHWIFFQRIECNIRDCWMSEHFSWDSFGLCSCWMNDGYIWIITVYCDVLSGTSTDFFDSSGTTPDSTIDVEWIMGTNSNIYCVWFLFFSIKLFILTFPVRRMITINISCTNFFEKVCVHHSQSFYAPLSSIFQLFGRFWCLPRSFWAFDPAIIGRK